MLPCRCILSKFYIKPQPYDEVLGQLNVVSYRNSTSNHNSSAPLNFPTAVVSYRNSTSNHNLLQEFVNCERVVSYRNSTSNHNMPRPSARVSSLYLIEILHQTTTRQGCFRGTWGCILSKFYIKPQPCSCAICRQIVVSYRNSTSNHNNDAVSMTGVSVVSYRNSTSNHNRSR